MAFAAPDRRDRRARPADAAEARGAGLGRGTAPLAPSWRGPATVYLSAFRQGDACELVDTRYAVPVRLRRRVRLACEELPATPSFWGWLMGADASDPPAEEAPDRGP